MAAASVVLHQPMSAQMLLGRGRGRAASYLTLLVGPKVGMLWDCPEDYSQGTGKNAFWGILK